MKEFLLRRGGKNVFEKKIKKKKIDKPCGEGTVTKKSGNELFNFSRRHENNATTGVFQKLFKTPFIIFRSVSHSATFPNRFFLRKKVCFMCDLIVVLEWKKKRP